MKQMTFAAAKGFEVHGRATRKAQFLVRMQELVPWGEFCALIEAHYPKAGNGRPPVGLERMLRMYLVANWFNLSDEGCEEALYDVPAFRQFCRIDLGRERVPDATTLLQFRHLLEQHQIGAALFAKVGELLLANGLKLSGGTIVDATLIAAPPSTKNEQQNRDPQMHQSKKGKQWHFGMKVHIGVDSQSGLHKHRPLSEQDKQTNRRKSTVRSIVEHPFLTLKRLWGFAKVRYRGLAKNANRAYAMLALINLSKWGRPLTPKMRPA